MNKEYEIKSKISDELRAKICSEFPAPHSSEQIDEYFDTANADLFQKGVFIRNRENRHLDIKYNPNLLDSSHTFCDEYRFNYDLSKSDSQSILDFLQGVGLQIDVEPISGNIHEVLSSYGLSSFVTIKKERQNIPIGSGVECVIDDIDDLGSFIEIEVNTESNLPLLDAWIRKFELKNIPIGYVELWLRKNNMALYLKGRYLLSEDK